MGPARHARTPLRRGNQACGPRGGYPTGPREPLAIDPLRRRRPGRRDLRIRLLPGALIGALIGTTGLSAQATDSIDGSSVAACTAGLIQEIDIDNRSIFDLEQIGDRPFAWAFKLANRLHVRTRAGFIRNELLFSEGECLDPFLLAESERILRGYDFISQADVAAVEQSNGRHVVTVQTQDEWTTQLDLGVSFDGGFSVETIELTEENFLGRGMELEVFLEERREMRDYGLRFRSNSVLGTRWDSRLTMGRTRVGDFYGAGFAYPFVAEVGRYGASLFYDRREDLFSYALPETGSPAPEHSNVVVPFTVERFHVAGAARWGEPGDLTMLGLGITRESLRFRDYPASVALIRDGSFGDPEPADSSVAALISNQIRSGWKTRVNVLLGWRKVRFARHRGLDALRGVQDVLLGSDLGLTLGANPGRIGSGGFDRSDDIFAELRHAAGFRAGPFLFNSQVQIEGRNVLNGSAFAGGGWRDVLAEADAFLYWQPAADGSHTVVTRVAAAGGNNVTFPFQVTLGGREGVRGFPTDDFPGGSRLIATLEDRRAFNWPAPDVVDFGTSLFLDVGRTWPGDSPFGRDSGWQAAIGGGIRLGLPEGTSGVARLDLAFPLTGGRGLGDVVFRVSMREFVGLIGGVEDEQMERSRITGIGPSVFQSRR